MLFYKGKTLATTVLLGSLLCIVDSFSNYNVIVLTTQRTLNRELLFLRVNVLTTVCLVTSKSTHEKQNDDDH